MPSTSHEKMHRFADANDWRCTYCARDVFCGVCYPSLRKSQIATRDHVIPRSQGGRGSDNLVLACLDCNQKKADRAWGQPKPPRKVREGCIPSRGARPRKAFAELLWAEMMCAAVLAEHGVQLVPYRCARCVQWHVRRAAEQTADRPPAADDSRVAA